MKQTEIDKLERHLEAMGLPCDLHKAIASLGGICAAAAKRIEAAFSQVTSAVADITEAAEVFAAIKPNEEPPYQGKRKRAGRSNTAFTASVNRNRPAHHPRRAQRRESRSPTVRCRGSATTT